MKNKKKNNNNKSYEDKIYKQADRRTDGKTDLQTE